MTFGQWIDEIAGELWVYGQTMPVQVVAAYFRRGFTPSDAIEDWFSGKSEGHPDMPTDVFRGKVFSIGLVDPFEDGIAPPVPPVPSFPRLA